MSKYIKILPERVINKIAAGEVIQRPESAIKELMENSIDAGAKKITVIIKDSGKSLLQIIDDGSGMSPEDAEICFIRHSTSKINDENDLDSIHTLGFRGEALSSIAAISQVELKTRCAADELGTVINIENSQIINTVKDNVETGTSISVKNLFFNTPARRNFLKTDSTELKHIFDTFTRFCICYPEIWFKLINNENVVHEYEPSGNDERIKQIFRSQDFEDLIYFEEDIDFIKMRGYIGKPHFLKKNRGEQYLFLNRRYITNKAINHAVYTAFENYAKVQGYPFYILFLNIDPSKVDINVHPSKLEVKFSDDRSIYTFVNSVIKKALGSSNLIPHYGFVENKDEKSDFNPDQKRGMGERSFKNDDNDKGFPRVKNYGTFNFNKQEKFNIGEYAALFNPPKETTIFSEKTVSEQTTFKEYEHQDETEIIKSEKGIWQLHLKYIVAQIKTGIIFIDQHVAHERILYEKALLSLKNNLPLSQQLLFPKTIELSTVDFQMVKEILKDLTDLGFVIKIFSKQSIVMEGIPVDVKFGNEEKILMEILEDLRNNKEPQMNMRDKLAATFACKAAIKFGDFLTQNEMVSLVDRLFATSMPYVCPHGRPTMIKVTIEELDKRFGRK